LNTKRKKRTKKKGQRRRAADIIAGPTYMENYGTVYIVLCFFFVRFVFKFLACFSTSIHAAMWCSLACLRIHGVKTDPAAIDSCHATVAS